MADALEGFVTGFANTFAVNTLAKKKEARDYYAQQLERANTRGVAALNERRDRLKKLTTITNTLMKQGGMPEDILRVVVNEGPDAVEQAYKIYTTAAENGTKLDGDFWNGVVDYSVQVKGDDEPLGDFLSKSVGLFDANLKADKSKGGDPISAFMAAGLGWNALDRAQGNLDSTEVADGYSANDLLKMEQSPQYTSPYGDTGTTFDLTEANNYLTRAGNATAPYVGGDIAKEGVPTPDSIPTNTDQTSFAPAPMSHPSAVQLPSISPAPMGPEGMPSVQPSDGPAPTLTSMDKSDYKPYYTEDKNSQKALSLDEKIKLQTQFNTQYDALKNQFISTNKVASISPEQDKQLRQQAAMSVLSLDPRAKSIDVVAQNLPSDAPPDTQNNFNPGDMYEIQGADGSVEQGTFVRVDEQGFPVFSFNRGGKPVEETVQIESAPEEEASLSNVILETDGSPKAEISFNGSTLTLNSAEIQGDTVVYVYTDESGGIHKFPIKR